MSEVTATGNPSPADSPDGVTFPYGFFSFTISGIGPGGDTTVTLYLPPGATPDVYYKHGPLPANPTPDWYRFMLSDDGITGAEISGNVITLHFTDRRKGDDITTVEDGMIIDIGAPGRPGTTGDTGSTGSTGGTGSTGSTGGGSASAGGGGGGCFAAILF
jgi:hypothetical protein